MVQEITNSSRGLHSWVDGPTILYSPQLRTSFQKLQNNLYPLTMLNIEQQDRGKMHYGHMIDDVGFTIREYYMLSTDQNIFVQGTQLTL